ncbi:MAG: hypothetical protein WCF36_11170 [Candidatus Nanopelagicales bacterium]
MANWEDDDALMTDLESATAQARAVTDRARAAARAAFAWRTIDEELMGLGHDSLHASASVVRGPGALARVVSFQARGFTLELELELEQDRLMGQVVPGGACVVSVLLPDGSARRAEVDASGFFSIEAIGRGPRRFTVEIDGRTQSSPWLVV